MIEFLPGFERRLRGNNGGYETGGPWTLLLHTTEGGLLGSIGALDKNNAWPQLLVDFTLGRRIQAYPLSMPGRSLADRAGGVSTNRRGRIIQVEIVGFAHQSHLWGDGAYRFLADTLRPVFAGGVGSHGPLFYGTDAGFTLATANAPQRMTYATWNGFGGVCGHQHAPENDHWDPGRFDLARFLLFVGTGSAPTPTLTDPIGGTEMYAAWDEGNRVGWIHRLGTKPKKITGKQYMLIKANRLMPAAEVSTQDMLELERAMGYR